MSIFFGFFHRRRRSPAYYKLKRCLNSEHFYKKIKQAYYLFCLPHSPENLRLLKAAISDSHALEILRKSSDYDMNRDSLELYFVLSDDGGHYFVFILDPHDIEKREKILEIIPAEQSLELIGKPVM
jgi:hypothetical protein